MKEDIQTLSNYLDTLQREGQYFFSRKKVYEVLHLSPIAFHHALYRLNKKGRIQRVRGDFYNIIPLEHQNIGSVPATWFIDQFMNSLSTQYYVGILSSAALHGAAHQQPMVFQVITDRPMRPINLGRLHLEFYYKKLIMPNFYSAVKTEAGAMQVATPEMTACDLLRYLNAAAQINNVATVLIELAEKIDISVFNQYARQGWVDISTIQRLGYLLESLDLELPPLDELALWVQTHTRCYRPLVRGHQAPVLKRNARWRILVNEEVEPDL